MIMLCLISAVGFLALALALPPIDAIEFSFAGYLLMSAVGGFFRGALDPCFFELSTELAFVAGVQAGTAGTMLTGMLHAVMILFLTIGTVAPAQFNDIMPMAMPCGMVIAALLLFAVQEK